MNTSTLGKTNLSISRIGLGTAEIGFAYGIGPRTLPSESEAIDFLKAAVDLGITFFDTASYYGEAETRIGKSGILKNPSIVVETKCAKFLEKGEYFPRALLEQKIRADVTTSLSKLGVDALPILMLHGPSRDVIEKGELIEILATLKKEGKVRFTGVSTRGEESPLSAIASDFFDVIQVAYSILDQRMVKNVFPSAKKANVGIINRSVLLKGALTPAVIHLPETLAPLKANSAKAEKIAKELSITLPELALRFTLSESAIATSLIGTNNIVHLKSSVKALGEGPLPPDVVSKLHELSINDPLQVDPAQWPKNK